MKKIKPVYGWMTKSGYREIGLYHSESTLASSIFYRNKKHAEFNAGFSGVVEVKITPVKQRKK